MNTVLFEDDCVEQLFPIALTRPAYAITCGSLRLVDLAKRLNGEVRGVVRSYLRAFQQDYNVIDGPPLTSDKSVQTLWLNARIIPDAAWLRPLREKVAAGKPFRIMSGDRIVAALTFGTTPFDEDNWNCDSVSSYLESTEVLHPSTDDLAADIPLLLANYPHEIIAQHKRLTAGNLEFILANNPFREIADGVFSIQKMAIPNHVAFDTSAGPVLIGQDVQFGAYSVINGPVSIGNGTKISPQTFLKGPISIGHTTKLGGEIGSSVIDPYSNKVHFGFLGSSWLGSWINLGAGTTNSNLKNTYGSIRVEYGGRKIDTGLQFLGCVIGDLTKTAIHTAIYTGKILGACSNVYGTVTENVPSFANYARSLGDITEHPADVMKVTQKRCFARRGIEQLPRHTQLLDDIYEIESPKRKLANKALSL